MATAWEVFLAAFPVIFGVAMAIVLTVASILGAFYLLMRMVYSDWFENLTDWFENLWDGRK